LASSIKKLAIPIVDLGLQNSEFKTFEKKKRRISLAKPSASSKRKNNLNLENIEQDALVLEAWNRLH